MLTGLQLHAHPTDDQRLILSQWMGSAKTIWNAKCEEERYHTRFARRFCPIGTYAPIDQCYSRFKSKDLSPWLYQVPSQLLRNSAVNWYKTYQKFMKGQCGKPRRKRRTGEGSAHLTSELFRFEKGEDGVERLFIGTKTNNIGFLSIKNHTGYRKPKTLYIRKRHGRYTVSFCYDDSLEDTDLKDNKQHLAFLRKCSKESLERQVIGIDRGIARPVQAGNKIFDFTLEQKRKKDKKERYIKRQQKKLSRQLKSSRRRQKTKSTLSKAHLKVANIRLDFCHKTSHALVHKTDCSVIVFEDLRTKNMTRKPKPKKDPVTGKWLKNKARAKAGLNKAIFAVGWHRLETFTKYKTHRAGKAFFKVSAHHTSQECAACSHTHPSNRETQALFVCRECGHVDNADHNAAMVIKKRAIDLILHSGTELSARGVLIPADTGRGAKGKTRKTKVNRALGNESSKKNSPTLLDS